MNFTVYEAYILNKVCFFGLDSYIRIYFAKLIHQTIFFCGLHGDEMTGSGAKFGKGE